MADRQAQDSRTERGRDSLTASASGASESGALRVAPGPTVGDYRRMRYERMAENLRHRYENGLPLSSRR